MSLYPSNLVRVIEYHVPLPGLTRFWLESTGHSNLAGSKEAERQRVKVNSDRLYMTRISYVATRQRERVGATDSFERIS